MKSLRIIGKINKELESKILHFKEIDNEFVIGFFIDYSESNINLNHVFNSISFNGLTENIEFKLVHITNQLLFSYDKIEIGYKTICFFKFSKYSVLLNQIKTCENWSDFEQENFALIK